MLSRKAPHEARHAAWGTVVVLGRGSAGTKSIEGGNRYREGTVSLRRASVIRDRPKLDGGHHTTQTWPISTYILPALAQSLYPSLSA
jgi:hypothetical protein